MKLFLSIMYILALICNVSVCVFLFKTHATLIGVIYSAITIAYFGCVFLLNLERMNEEWS